MKEDNKYYTPTIDEFHVGFEYEHYSYNAWCTDTITIRDMQSDSNMDAISRSILKVRVKYLDTDDILELGWKHSNTTKVLILYTYKNHYLSYYEDGKILIEHLNDNSPIFYGNIKNKSELKRLMKQLNI